MGTHSRLVWVGCAMLAAVLRIGACSGSRSSTEMSARERARPDAVPSGDGAASDDASTSVSKGETFNLEESLIVPGDVRDMRLVGDFLWVSSYEAGLLAYAVSGG